MVSLGFCEGCGVLFEHLCEPLKGSVVLLGGASLAVKGLCRRLCVGFCEGCGVLLGGPKRGSAEGLRGG